MSSFMDLVVQRVLDGGLSSESSVVGCSDIEILDLERYFDIRLPEAYKQFLNQIGKGAGLFMRGTDFFYDRLFDNRKALQEVLDLEHNPFVLSRDTFVFSSHQGYIFFFFDTAQDLDDPP